MNKKGQTLSIIAFFAIILAVFILGVILMSFVTTILTPVQSSLGNISDTAGQSVGAISDSFNKWFDIFIILLFILNVIILLVSSFLVDIHPAFLVIYVIALVFLMIFGGNVVGSLGSLWDTGGAFDQNGELTSLPLTVWMLNHFTLVVLGIAILSGIIMYAKFKFGNQGGAY